MLSLFVLYDDGKARGQRRVADSGGPGNKINGTEAGVDVVPSSSIGPPIIPTKAGGSGAPFGRDWSAPAEALRGLIWSAPTTGLE